jgi:hypothetical protein
LHTRSGVEKAAAVSTSDSRSPYDEFFEPLSLALGHLVFAAAALEKALFTDLVQRRIKRDGLEGVFGDELISRLVRMPAGALLNALREFGYGDELAKEIATAIDSRNRLIHHLYEDPDFIEVVAQRKGLDGIVERVEALVESIHVIVVKLEPGLASSTEQIFGGPPMHLLSQLQDLDLDAIDDEDLRKQLKAIRSFPDDFMNS